MYLGVFSSIVDGSPVFARDTVLNVEVSLYPSLQFAHCSADMRRPVFCSLSMETCSEPVCLPRLLPALGISPPGGCSQPLGTEGEGGTPDRRLNWIFRDKLGLAVAQTSALPRTARRFGRHRRAYLPMPRSSSCQQAGAEREWAGVRQQPSDAFPSTIKKEEKKIPNDSLKCLQEHQVLPK